MKQKLIIVNNGLRDYRGHYFETSISLADAARRAGLHPVLATHVDCPTAMLPEWLESYPIFRTDHWMATPPAASPELRGLSMDLYSAEQPTIEDVCRGDATVRQLIARYYGPLRAGDIAAVPILAKIRERLRRNLCKMQWFCEKGGWAADRAAFFLLPPILYDWGKSLAALTNRHCVPRALRREFRPRIKNGLFRILRRIRSGRFSSVDIASASFPPEIARSLQQPFEGGPIRAALAVLPAQFLQELEYGLIFKQDLERLLALSRVGPEDHVLLGTAHAREAPAVHLISKRLGDGRSPHFHLEFRHPLFQSDPTPREFEESPNVLMHRSFFSICEKWGLSSRMHFYTDTQELSRDHDLLGAIKFGVLPIPFRTELAAPPRRSPDGCLRLAYLGEARDEKGFPWLPDLIERLKSKYVSTGKVRFILQANVSAPQYNPKSAAILPRLTQYSEQHVRLVGLDAPLSPEDYYQLLSEADIVLLPYDRDRYRACSSGTLAEAMASGRPVVVPADSWMSSQLGPGTGETFEDRESFFAAVERLIENFESYRSNAENYRSRWLAMHTPDRLIDAVVGAGCRAEPERIAA